MRATIDSLSLLNWLSQHAASTAASSSNHMSLDDALQQAASADPAQLLQAALANQQALALLLQQVPQHKDAIKQQRQIWGGEPPPKPAVLVVFEGMFAAATSEQLQQLLEMLLQHMQPGSDSTTAAGAGILLNRMHERASELRMQKEDVHVGPMPEMLTRIISLQLQLLLAKALEHSDSSVVEAVSGLIVRTWEEWVPWRSGGGATGYAVWEFENLLDSMRQELQQGTSWAAHWLFVTMRFCKYEPRLQDYAAMFAAAAAEIQSLQQEQHLEGQPMYALPAACCLANTGDTEDELIGLKGLTDHNDRLHMITHYKVDCAATVALWLFGPRGLEAVTATPAQAAAASQTVVQATKSLLTMLKRATDSNCEPKIEAIGCVVERVLKTAASSTGMANAKWLLAGLAAAMRATGNESSGWLFKKLIDVVPEPLQQQLMAPLLQDLSSNDSVVARAAAQCLKRALTSAMNEPAKGLRNSLSLQQHWDMLLRVWNSEDDAVAAAAQLALESVCLPYHHVADEPPQLPAHVLATLQQQIAGLQQGTGNAPLLYNITLHTSAGEQLLLPHLPALLAAAAAAENSAAQAAALAILCRLVENDRKSFRKSLLPKLLQMQKQQDPAFPPHLQRWLLKHKEAAESEESYKPMLLDGQFAEAAAAMGLTMPDPTMIVAPGVAPQAQTPAAAAAMDLIMLDPTVFAAPGIAPQAQTPAAAAGVAAAQPAPAADAVAADAAAEMPHSLVEYLSSGCKQVPSNRQQQRHQRFCQQVLRSLITTRPGTVLQAVLEHGWLPAFVASDEVRDHVAWHLTAGAPPELLEQLVSQLLHDVASSNDLAALTLAVDQTQAFLCPGKRELQSLTRLLPSILAQQHHWQLLAQLLQHEVAVVAELAVHLISIVISDPVAVAEQQHVEQLLQQQAAALQHDTRSADMLFRHIHSRWTQQYMKAGPEKLSLLVPLMPSLQAAAASSSNSKLLALQLLQLCCDTQSGQQELSNQDCSWLFELVQPQPQASATSAEIAFAAVEIIKQLLPDPARMGIPSNNRFVQLMLQPVLHYVQQLPTVGELLRSKLLSCCESLIHMLHVFSESNIGVQAVFAKHMDDLLHIMQQPYASVAESAGDLVKNLVTNSDNVQQLLQQQHIDSLFSIINEYQAYESTDFESLQESAARILAAAAKKPAGCQLLSTPETLDKALDAFAQAEDIYCYMPEAKLLRVISKVIAYVCEGNAPGVAAVKLSALVKFEHVIQLINIAVECDEFAREVLSALARIASHGGWKMQLWLAPHRPALQQVLQRRTDVIEHNMAELQEQIQRDGMNGYNPAIQNLQQEFDWSKSEAPLMQQDFERIEAAVAQALVILDEKIVEAKRDMHEAAGQYAEQYAAYRALRVELSASKRTATSQPLALTTSNIVAVANTGLESSQKRSKSAVQLGGSSVLQQRVELQKQLQSKCDVVVAALGDLVVASDAVNGLQDMLDAAQAASKVKVPRVWEWQACYCNCGSGASS